MTETLTSLPRSPRIPTREVPAHTAGRRAAQSRRAAAARSGALDGLRGSAALAVLVFHVWLYRPGGPPGPRRAFADKVLFELNLGLVCFFVLSGYLLYRSFARAALGATTEVDLRGYARRRAARILPGYYVCLVGALLLYALVGAGDLVPPFGQVASFFVFAQSYSPATLTAVNAVTWTLCVEAAFYLLLPLLGWAALRLGPRRVGLQVALLLALVGSTAAWNALAHVSGWSAVATKSLPAYIGAFALGMLVALWAERRSVNRGGHRGARLSPRASAVLAIAGAALVVGTGYWHERWGSHTIGHQVLVDLPAAAGFALLIAALVAGRGPAPALFRVRPLVEAGVISYGLYLWHIPLILVLLRVGLLPGALPVRLVVVLALTATVAWLSWRVVERPVLRRAR